MERFYPRSIPNTMTIDALSLYQSASNELRANLLVRCQVLLAGNIGMSEFFMDKIAEGDKEITNRLETTRTQDLKRI